MAFRYPSLSPELDAIDEQMLFARDPAQDTQLQKALADAEARLATVDKTKLNEYAAAMQQVLMIRKRINSPFTRDQLLAQKVALLENMLTPPQA